jgi:hypothetical protein
MAGGSLASSGQRRILRQVRRRGKWPAMLVGIFTTWSRCADERRRSHDLRLPRLYAQLRMRGSLLRVTTRNAPSIAYSFNFLLFF